MATRRSVISGSRNSISGDARKAFQIEGLDEIQRKLGDIIDAVNGKKVKEVYLEGAIILRDEAKKNAPYDPKRKSGTHLRDAIFAARGDDNKPNVLVGVRYKSAPHAHIVEYGSVKTSAHPYIRPAIAATGSKIASTINDGLLDIIEDAAK